MPEAEQGTVSKRFFWWLVLLFGLGNLVFVNIFAQLAGFIGLPLGIGVSASLKPMALLMLRQREGE